MADIPLVSPLLAGLFGDDETAALFSAEAEIAAMVEVERALARLQGRAGLIPADAAAALDRELPGILPTPAELAAGTAAAGVPVPALVAALRQKLSRPAADYLHFGATSQDIVDTGLMLRLARTLELFEARLADIVGQLSALAARHRATPMAGRTRGQIATPISFGLRVAIWTLPLARARKRLARLRREALVVQLGGACGDLGAMDVPGRAAELAGALAGELGLVPSLPWMTDREPLRRIAREASEIALALGKIGEDVILLARSEVGEIRLAEAGGSSTMPQKQNPVRAEALVALARFAAAQAAALSADALHREERDGAAWMGEWLVLPQVMLATGAALRHAQALAPGMEADATRMAATATGGGGLSLAERFSFALLPHVGRTAAQDLVKKAAGLVRTEGGTLAEALSRLSDAPLDWQALADPASISGAAAAMTDEMLAEIAALMRGE